MHDSFYFERFNKEVFLVVRTFESIEGIESFRFVFDARLDRVIEGFCFK